MARARVSHTRGRGFKSLLAHLMVRTNDVRDGRGRTGSVFAVCHHGLLWGLNLQVEPRTGCLLVYACPQWGVYRLSPRLTCNYLPSPSNARTLAATGQQ
jgi:hypothetical protein